MTQYRTGYCAACETQVTRRDSDGGLGPDGQLYCDECLAKLARPGEPRRPAGPGSGPRSRAPRDGLPRVGSTPARPRPAAAPRRPAMSRTTLVGVGSGALALVLTAVWLTNRPDEAPRPPRDEPAKTAVAPPKGGAPPPTPGPPSSDLASGPPTLQPTPPPPVSDVVSASDARALAALEGRMAKVGGTVTRAAAAKSGKVFFINFSDERDAFVAVIFQKEIPAFEKRFGGDLAVALAGRSVVVSGKVTTYQGRLQMVLEEPSQLEVK